MKKHIAALTIGTLAAFSPTAVAGDAWFADFDEAVEVARKDGKDLLVDFTGSDWCHWCKVLDKEVFAFEEWTTAVTKDYVLVALDFPNSEEAKAKVPNPERNEELKNKYTIRGFPTVLMMTVDGEVYAQTGYQEGGYEKYLEHMKEIREAGRPLLVEAKRAVAAFEAAEGQAKWKAWEDIVAKLEALEGQRSPFIPVLAQPVRWAFEADPKNEKGKMERAARVLLKVGQIDDEIVKACREIDPGNKSGLLAEAYMAMLESGKADEALIKGCRDIDPKNESGLLERAVVAQFEGIDGENEEEVEAAIRALDQLNPLGFQNKSMGCWMNFMAARLMAYQLEDEAAAMEYALKAREIGSENARLLEAVNQLIEELE